MTLTLTPELEALVERQIVGGQFGSPQEVLTAALRLLEPGPDRVTVRSPKDLDEKIQEGLDAVGRGELFAGKDFEAEMKARSGARRSGSK